MRAQPIAAVKIDYFAGIVHHSTDREARLDVRRGLDERFVHSVAIEKRGANSLATIELLAVECEFVCRRNRPSRREAWTNELASSGETREVVKCDPAEQDDVVVFGQRAIQLDRYPARRFA